MLHWDFLTCGATTNPLLAQFVSTLVQSKYHCPRRQASRSLRTLSNCNVLESGRTAGDGDAGKGSGEPEAAIIRDEDEGEDIKLTEQIGKGGKSSLPSCHHPVDFQYSNHMPCDCHLKWTIQDLDGSTWAPTKAARSPSRQFLERDRWVR